MVFKRYDLSKYDFFWIVFTILIALNIGGSYYLYNLATYRGQALSIETRWLLLATLNISIITCLALIYLLKKKYPLRNNIFSIDKIVFALLMVEILVYISLTPIWLNLLYGLPHMPSVFIRIVRAAFIIVIKAVFVYMILRTAQSMNIQRKNSKERN